MSTCDRKTRMMDTVRTGDKPYFFFLSHPLSLFLVSAQHCYSLRCPKFLSRSPLFNFGRLRTAAIFFIGPRFGSRTRWFGKMFPLKYKSSYWNNEIVPITYKKGETKRRNASVQMFYDFCNRKPISMPARPRSATIGSAYINKNNRVRPLI